MQEVAAASGRGRKTFKRLRKVEDPRCDFARLAHSGRTHKSIDVKLAAALTEIARGPLGRIFTNHMETELKAGRMIEGRQILWVVQQHFKVNEDAGAAYDVQVFCLSSTEATSTWNKSSTLGRKCWLPRRRNPTRSGYTPSSRSSFARAPSLLSTWPTVIAWTLVTLIGPLRS